MKKQVNYKVNGEEWKEAKDKAFNKLVKKVKIDGFREGKVPRNVFEKKYGTGDIISEAMEDLVQKKYGEVIITEKLIPVVEPKLEIVKALNIVKPEAVAQQERESAELARIKQEASKYGDYDTLLSYGLK